MALENTTKLYQALSGLNLTDTKIYSKLRAVSGAVSGLQKDLGTSQLTADIPLLSSGKIHKQYLSNDLASIQTIADNALTGVTTTSSISGKVTGHDVALDVRHDKTLLDVRSDVSGLSVNYDDKTIKSSGGVLYVPYDDGTIKMDSNNKLSVNLDNKTLSADSGNSSKIYARLGSGLTATASAGIEPVVDNKTIKIGTNGFYSPITLSSLGPSGDFASRYALVGADGSIIGSSIDVAKDQFLVGSVVRKATSADVTQAGKQNLTITAGDLILVMTMQLDRKDALSGQSNKKDLIVPLESIVDTIYTAGSGVQLDTTSNTFSAKADTNGAISTSGNLSVIRGKGLVTGTNDIQIGQGNGITVGDTSIAAKANGAQGIAVDANGIKAIYTSGLAAVGSSDSTNSGKLYVDLGKGLTFSENKVTINNATAGENYLNINTNGVVAVSGVDAAISSYVKGELVGANGSVSDPAAGTVYKAINTLSGALTGYTGSKAVSTEFKAIKDLIGGNYSSTSTVHDAITGKISKVSGETGEIPLFASDGSLESSNKFFTEAISSTVRANYIPTEKAVKDQITADINTALYGSTTAAAGGITGTDATGGLLKRITTNETNFATLSGSYSKLISAIAGLNSKIDSFEQASAPTLS